MSKSNIEWTEMTWNPSTGCSKISQGCKFCYAEVMSQRLNKMGQEKYINTFKLTVHPKSLLDPIFWKKPMKVFVNSMSDLFHEDVPTKFIEDVFKVMNYTSQHQFQILTKRAGRLQEIAPRLKWTANIWMGVSVENDTVLERIVALAQTPAKIKFLSIEPMVGPIEYMDLSNINWVIVGGESGNKARKLEEDWVELIRLMCLEKSIPFFFKQWGKTKFNPNKEDPTIDPKHPFHAKGGCQLNNEIYRQFPNNY